MSPVLQTRFGQSGNCLAACIATILGCELALVDFSCADTPGAWAELACAKIAFLGVTLLYIKGRPTRWVHPEQLYIGSGPTGRGTFYHSVVFRGQLMVHDPHPSGDGILSVESCVYLVKR